MSIQHGRFARQDGVCAPFDADLTFPVPLEKIGLFVPAYNANLPVNAIPYVCAAAPGILTTEDLSPIVPRGPRAKNPG
jgi:hypothetical protein